MKTDRFQRRFYRDWVTAKGLFKANVSVKETDITVLSDRPIDKDLIAKKINFYRGQIEDYIARDRRFLVSLKPLAVELSAPFIVKKMAAVAKSAGVGPMAAVAGAIAQCLGRDFLRAGFKNVIIENGGDIFLKLSRPFIISIYAGRSRRWKDLRIRISRQKKSIGICTSSGTIGHSLSFGRAESVVILAKDAFLADAVATATANRVQNKNSLQPALEFARSVKSVLGAVIIFKNNLASFGEGFEFVK